VEIPTNLPSDCGMDYVPLATMLATGQLAEADQVCSQRICHMTNSENETVRLSLYSFRFTFS
jgi:hypothetical protein